MRHLNVANATIAAVSSGSGLAVDFTIEHPSLVDRLILMGPVLHGMYESPDIDVRGAALNAPVDHGDYEKAARNWSTDPTTIERTDVTGQKILYDDIMRYPQSLKFGGQNEIRLSPPAALRLSEVRVPTLILVGKDDHPDVHAFAGALENGIAGARRLLVVGAAHLVQIDKPAAISAEITQYGHMARVVHVAPATLASYAGRYDAGRYDRDGKIVTIASDGDRLLLEAPAEPNLPIWPTSDNTFFMQAGTDDITIRFQPDARGTMHAILSDSSGSVAWPRVAA